MEKQITKSMKLKLVEAGRKGVTNKQMLASLNSNLNDQQLIQLLADYPTVFMGSIKYTKDAMKVKLEALANSNGYPDFKVTTGKKIRNKVQVTTQPVVEEPKIIVLQEYKNKNNEKMSKVAEKFQTLSQDEQEIVKEMVEKDLGITEIAKQLGLTKDQAYNKIFRSKKSIYNRLAN